jgi:hypothetical protein
MATREAPFSPEPIEPKSGDVNNAKISSMAAGYRSFGGHDDRHRNPAFSSSTMRERIEVLQSSSRRLTGEYSLPVQDGAGGQKRQSIPRRHPYKLS